MFCYTKPFTKREAHGRIFCSSKVLTDLPSSFCNIPLSIYGIGLLTFKRFVHLSATQEAVFNKTLHRIKTANFV